MPGFIGGGPPTASPLVSVIIGVIVVILQQLHSRRMHLLLDRLLGTIPQIIRLPPDRLDIRLIPSLPPPETERFDECGKLWPELIKSKRVNEGFRRWARAPARGRIKGQLGNLFRPPVELGREQQFLHQARELGREPVCFCLCLCLCFGFALDGGSSVRRRWSSTRVACA